MTYRSQGKYMKFMFCWVPHAVVFFKPTCIHQEALRMFDSGEKKKIHNKNRVQNKNQLNKSHHMFFILLYSIKEVNVVLYTGFPAQKLLAILFNFIFKESPGLPSALLLK